MRRATRKTGILLSSLMSLMTAACGDDGGGGAGVDAGPRPDGGAECAPSEALCGDTCVDLATSEEHCGDCDTACGPLAQCVDGECINPLAAIETEGFLGGVGDVYVLHSQTADLTRITSVGSVGGQIIDHLVLADGSLVVAEENVSTGALYHAAADGSSLTRLGPALSVGQIILPGLVASTDGSTVLFRAVIDNPGAVELYAVRLSDPETRVKVNGVLVAGGQVSRNFAVSADGKRAVYLASQDSAPLYEAYTVDLSSPTPGASEKLNPAVTDSIREVALSPDGSVAVYREFRNDDGTGPLFAVSTSAPGTAAQIKMNDAGTGYVERGYQFGPDGALYFVGSEQNWGALDGSLWKVALSAPFDSDVPATKIIAGEEDVHWVRGDFALTSDGKSVIYHQSADLGSFPFTDSLYRLDFDNPDSPILLSADPGDGSDVSVIATDFVLSRDESAVVFRAGADGAEGPDLESAVNEPDVREFAPTLYYVDLTAQASTPPSLISAAVDVDTEEGIAPGYVVSRDGSEVVYRADHDVPELLDAYYTTTESPEVQRVTPPSPEPVQVSQLRGF